MFTTIHGVAPAPALLFLRLAHWRTSAFELAPLDNTKHGQRRRSVNKEHRIDHTSIDLLMQDIPLMQERDLAGLHFLAKSAVRW